MKILVQDTETKQYLCGDGQWVAAATEAEDFGTILPAYKFARHHASGHFQVVLFCPEDKYTKSIIDGNGMARTAAPTPEALAPLAKMKIEVSWHNEKRSPAPAVSLPAARFLPSQRVQSPPPRFDFN